MQEFPGLVEITHAPIAVDKLLALVTTPLCGAQVLFVGTTRQWTGQTETLSLEYQAYEGMARELLVSLESEARRRWPIEEVAMVHRLGQVDIGQASVAVAVGAAHRDAAFAAARWLIDEIKLQVPIWKRESQPNDQQHWVHPQ